MPALATTMSSMFMWLCAPGNAAMPSSPVTLTTCRGLTLDFQLSGSEPGYSGWVRASKASSIRSGKSADPSFSTQVRIAVLAAARQAATVTLSWNEGG